MGDVIVLCVQLDRRLVRMVHIGSDHYKSFFAAKQERVLINHGLNDVFQVGPKLLKVAHVSEFDRYERWPPANCQILAVHAV